VQAIPYICAMKGGEIFAKAFGIGDHELVLGILQIPDDPSVVWFSSAPPPPKMRSAFFM